MRSSSTYRTPDDLIEHSRALSLNATRLLRNVDVLIDGALSDLRSVELIEDELRALVALNAQHGPQ